MNSRTCPTCGEARTGGFRYCRHCGFDFEPNHITVPGNAKPPEAPVSAPPAPAAGQTGPDRARSGWRAAQPHNRSGPDDESRPVNMRQDVLLLLMVAILAAAIGLIIPLLVGGM